MPKVNLPDGRVVHFPDDMAPADIERALGAIDTPPSQVVSASEPDTYVGGALKGLQEGMTGGARGFLRGFVSSPVSLARGVGTMLTQSPLTTARDMVGSVKGIPAAISAAGANPEAWGEQVGDITGQTMLTAAAPSVIGALPLRAAAGSVGRTMEAIGASKPAEYASGFGAYHRIMAGDVPGAAVAVGAPYALKKIGQGLQRLGTAGKAPFSELPPAGPHMDLTRPIQPGGLTIEQMQQRATATREAGGLPPQQLPEPPRQTVGQLRMMTGQGGPSGPEAIPPPTATLAPMQGQLRMAPDVAPPAATAAPAQTWNEFTKARMGDYMRSEGGHAGAMQRLGTEWQAQKMSPAPEMQAPRVDIGAEKVGRGAGLTKEAVRQATAPILGEAQGAASPILPEGALGKIIDRLKEMPKGGPEREAYVAKATSGKAQWQIENIRRTLEHLGLLVAAPVAGGVALRNTIMERLRGGSSASAGSSQPTP